MKKSVILFVVVVSMMLASAAVAADPVDSTHDGVSQPGPVLTGSHAPCQGGETVLVIQDNVEWFAPDDPRGNVVTELIAQQKNWCAIHSSQLAAANLAPFGEIIIPSAQNQTFYNNLFPGGVIDPNLDAWVLSGGVLSANLADFASGPGAGGNWFGDVFVGAVQHVQTFDNNVNIAAAGHPIITGTAPCPSGNCGAIVDAGNFTDLDGWGSSTHGSFTNLPGGTIVILVDSQGRPVMIEYPHGSGVVVATMTTSEWMYAGNFGFLPRNKKLLANEIAYQDSIVVIKVDIDIKPGSDPNSINTRSRGVIPVAILGSATFDVTDVDVTTLAFGPCGSEAALPAHDLTDPATYADHLQDVNGDGLTDLVSHYHQKETGLSLGDTEACLVGATTGGTPISGMDAVNIVK